MIALLPLLAWLVLVCAEEEEFISGHAFSQLATFNADARYKTNFNPHAAIKNGDSIFMNCGHRVLPNFLNQLNRLPSKGNKYVFITHNCDHSFTSASMHQLDKYASRIYAINNVCGEACYPLVQSIPLGFIDSKNHADKAHHVFIDTAKMKYEKEHLLFMNFMVNNNVARRAPCQRAFQGKPWVLSHESGLAPGETYTFTAKSKYVVSPPGAGIDCHRIYEAIYLDAIPILESSLLDHFYKHWPVIIVDQWDEITEEYLASNYEEHRKALDGWKLKYSNWTKAEFWLNSGNLGPFGEY